MMKFGWTIKKLGEVCMESKERIPSSSVSLTSYVTTDNMVKDCGGVVSAETLPSNGVGLVGYKRGDILLSNIRLYLKKLWLADRDGGAPSDVIVFRLIDKTILPAFLFRLLTRESFFDYVMKNVTGTKMPRGKRDWIKQFDVSFPTSLPEQRQIVKRLDFLVEKTKLLDQNYTRQIADCAVMRQSVLREAFEGRL